ncbi:MAG TPA: NAD(P)/FAD-dependent oxidoreductase [Nitrososphaeraceae archaeon]|nr:NAD(P)/FAD-dependent oxidoreductase [Nitrososphaeraceae archaeon]
MLECDIAVVGGGPAGLSSAYAAASEGSKVILFEKDDAIAHNIRTSGVSWIKEMQELKIPREMYNPIKNFTFISPSNEVTIKGNEFSSCVLDVRRVYQHLAMLAAEAGAKIMVRSRVYNLFSGPQDKIMLGVNTPLGNLEIKPELIIDASGFSSVVGSKLGLVKPWRRYGIGAEYECYCDNVDLETWYLMVGKCYSDAGYAWVFPLSKSRIRIGVGVGRPESNFDPVKKLNEMLEKKLKPLDRLKNIQPLEFHFGFIPNEGSRETTIADRLIIVGDSAGQSNPLVLEGIRYAVEFGRLAGKVGAQSLSKGSVKSSLNEYERIWKSKVQSKINAAMNIQSRWINLSDDQWDREIEMLRHMSWEEFLDFIRAEFTGTKMLRLALNHPRLAARELFSSILRRI